MLDRRQFLACLGFGTLAGAVAAMGCLDCTPTTAVAAMHAQIAPETLRAGDTFTIQGVYAVNPPTRYTVTGSTSGR